MAQSVDTFFVNRGLNKNQDVDLGETAPDLGGHIPFAALDDPSHYYAFTPTSTDPRTLRQLVEEYFLDLPQLDSLLADSNRAGKPVPPPHSVLVNTYNTPAWWGGGRNLNVWEYRINGGYAQFVRRDDNVDVDGDGVVHVLFEHMSSHVLDWSTLGFGAQHPFNASIYSWTDGGTNKMTIEQAVEAGDIYCFVTENYGSDFLIALERSQDADRFLRASVGSFSPAILDSSQVLGDTFVIGGSYGAAVSGLLGLLQPNVYKGTGWAFSLDWGYEMYTFGDWPRLQQYFEFGTGGDLFHGLFDRNLMGSAELMIDQLGLRFDDVAGPAYNWDLAALSVLRRPQDLKIRFGGFVGASDRFANWHWQHTPSRPTLSQTSYFKNQAHDGPDMVENLHNQFFQWVGDEWAQMKLNAAGASAANDLIPPGTTSLKPYADPYSHTLRHQCSGAYDPNGLITGPIDLNPDSSQIDTLGQGVWTGFNDSLEVGDFDGDGNPEIVFGNLEGYIHVLEVLPTASLPIASQQLRDEWRSPRLGWGLWAVSRSGNVLDFGNQQGQVFQLTTGGWNTYLLSTKINADPKLYDGAVRMVKRGNFNNSVGGNEYMILDHFLDWREFDSGGNWKREARRGFEGIGPGAGPVVKGIVGGDTDAESEVVIPAIDGHVWLLNEDLVGSLELQEIVPYSATQNPRAWFLAETIDPNKDGIADGLILLGRNDAEASGEKTRLVLYDFASSSVMVDMPIGINDIRHPSFAWLKPPGTGFPATFAVAGGGGIEAFQIDSPAGPILTTASVSIPVDVNPIAGEAAPGRRGVTALAPLILPTEPVTIHLVALTGNGRVWILDDDLTFMRTTRDVDPTIPLNEAVPWPSNRSMAHEFAVDHEQVRPSPNDPLSLEVYVANFQQRFRNVNGQPYNPWYRIEGLSLDENDVITFTPDYQSSPVVPSYAEGAPDATLHDGFATLNRFLHYRPGSPAVALAEGGTWFDDPVHGPRMFCNRSVDQNILPGLGLGGYAFEWLSTSDQAVITGFSTTPDPNSYYVNLTNPKNDWSIPKVGSSRPGTASSSRSPILDTMVQSVGLVWYGTSMTMAEHLPGSEQDPTRFVVTGTLGGYVYAIEVPSTKPLSGADEVSVASFYGTQDPAFYESDDLGWNAIGLDTGDLDSDGMDEIVAGVLVDDGNFDDWAGGNANKNRAHVTILKANNGHLDTVYTLDASDLPGSGQRIGSGVFGVKIDDVDADGQPEIWCGDAAGHLYLFRWDAASSAWKTAYKSECLAAFMGAFNRIIPFKEGLDPTGNPAGRTTKLIVMSSGYVYAFAVDPNAL